MTDRLTKLYAGVACVVALRTWPEYYAALDFGGKSSSGSIVKTYVHGPHRIICTTLGSVYSGAVWPATLINEALQRLP